MLGLNVQVLKKSGCGMTNWTCIFEDKRYCVMERDTDHEEDSIANEWSMVSN